jgi:prephenate dehydrogenase
MSAAAHDKLMAQVHALTFFLARGLSAYGLKANKFQTPSFQMLLDLVELDSKHSTELFETIEIGNPYAKQARADLLDKLNSIHKLINFPKN